MQSTTSSSPALKSSSLTLMPLDISQASSVGLRASSTQSPNIRASSSLFKKRVGKHIWTPNCFLALLSKSLVTRIQSNSICCAI